MWFDQGKAEHENRENKTGQGVPVEQREQTYGQTDVAGIASGVCPARWTPENLLYRVHALEWSAARTREVL